MDAIEDSLEAHLSRHTTRHNAVYTGLMVVVLGALLLVPRVRADVTVQGSGLVRPVVERHDIRAGASGIVEEVLVDRHQIVDAGEILLRLSDGAIRSRRDGLAGRLKEVRDALHDLELITVRFDHVDPTALRTGRHAEEYARFLRERHGLARAEDLARRELEREQALASQGLAAATEVEALAFRLEGSIENLVTHEMSHRGQWHGRLSDLRREVTELESRLDEADEEMAQRLIRSPIRGTVEELMSVSTGSVVQAGQTVAQVSPMEALVAEVLVAPRDVGLLRDGLPARLLIDAFNYNDWGALEGRIIQISDDYVSIDGSPRFRVTVQVDRPYLDLPSGSRAYLRKGMTLRARFHVADRSLWQLLRDDIDGWLNPLTYPPEP